MEQYKHFDHSTFHLYRLTCIGDCELDCFEPLTHSRKSASYRMRAESCACSQRQGRETCSWRDCHERCVPDIYGYGVARFSTYSRSGSEELKPKYSQYLGIDSVICECL